jgi:nitrate/TMAO reductase-like tetraheme cytochrome c subunit
MPKRRPVLLLALLLGSLPLFVRAQSDEDCLACHEDKDLKSEKGLPVFVDGEKAKASVHGQAGISCVDCHADLGAVSDYPHASPLRKVGCGGCHEEAAEEFGKSVHAEGNNTGASAVRVSCKDCHGTHEIRPGDDFDSLTFALNLPATCEKCHLERVKTERGTDFIRGYRESVHFKALEKSGLTMSANCGNCHGFHNIKSVDDPLSRVSRKNIIPTCGGCHVGIQRDYLEGVHGKDYIKGIKDVPVCTDCHSEHNILSPEDLESRVYATKVAGVCSRCHDDLSLSRQYGFLTSRLKTYSESFHGTAARFGETRVANCASCHGFHDIRPSVDPRSSINPENLPRTCGKCHPGASRHFAEGQIHIMPKEAARAKYRSSTIVKNIYIIVISVVIGIMIVFIFADFLRRILRKETHG